MRRFRDEVSRGSSSNGIARSHVDLTTAYQLRGLLTRVQVREDRHAVCRSAPHYDGGPGFRPVRSVIESLDSDVPHSLDCYSAALSPTKRKRHGDSVDSIRSHCTPGSAPALPTAPPRARIATIERGTRTSNGVRESQRTSTGPAVCRASLRWWVHLDTDQSVGCLPDLSKSGVPTRTIAFATYTDSEMPLQAIHYDAGGGDEAPSPRPCFQEFEEWRFAAPPARRYIALTFSQRIVRYQSAYKLHIALESDRAERRGQRRTRPAKKAVSWASLKPYDARRSRSQPVQITCALGLAVP